MVTKLILLTQLAIQLLLIEGMSVKPTAIVGEPVFMCMPNQCKTDNDCVRIGTKWSKDCFKYKCVRGEDDLAETKIVKKGCRWMNGKCKTEGKLQTSGCEVHQCMKDSTSRYLFKKIKSKPGCQWENHGKCRRVGTMKKMGCSVYKCMKQKGSRKYIFDVIKSKKGCSVDGHCLDIGKGVHFRDRPPCFCSDSGDLHCAVN